jgi:hypothetical protein
MTSMDNDKFLLNGYDVNKDLNFLTSPKMLLENLRKPTDGPISRYLNRPISIKITSFLVRYKTFQIWKRRTAVRNFHWSCNQPIAPGHDYFGCSFEF